MAFRDMVGNLEAAFGALQDDPVLDDIEAYLAEKGCDLDDTEVKSLLFIHGYIVGRLISKGWSPEVMGTFTAVSAQRLETERKRRGLG